MFFRVLYPCLLLFFLISSIVASSYSRVEAVAGPDSYTVEYARAYKNVHELGDMLFMMRYYLNYSVEPIEFASQTFLMAVTDGAGSILTDGTNTVSRPLADDGYGHNIQCIYLTAAQVTSFGIVWGGSVHYNLALMGNPTLFTTTTYVDSKYLDSGSWIYSATVATGQSYLKDGIIAQSRYLEGVDSSLTLTSNTSSGYKLSTGGNVFWLARYATVLEISGISAVSAQYMTVENQTYTGSYITELNTTATNMFGGSTTVKTAFTNLGDAIGIPYWQVIAFAVLLLPSFMIVSGTVYGISGNSKLAGIVAAPVMFVISMLIPDALLMILTGIAAFIIVAVMWRFV